MVSWGTERGTDRKVERRGQRRGGVDRRGIWKGYTNCECSLGRRGGICPFFVDTQPFLTSTPQESAGILS